MILKQTEDLFISVYLLQILNYLVIILDWKSYFFGLNFDNVP
jgi:hypothetical protein